MAWRGTRSYRAVQGGDGRWVLGAEGAEHSSHDGYLAAVREAETDDRRRRKARMVMRRLLVFAAAGILLIPVTLLREMDDPDHPPARQFADRMEAAFGSVDDGAAEAASFTVEEDGFAGAVIEVDIGEREADHNLLVGEHSGDCCVLRWVRFEVPFVARLLPRYECEPGSPAMSFDGARFEARAVNLFSDRPLNWREVLPARVSLAPWFFPAMVVLLFLMLHQAVSLSLVFLRGVPRRAVEVERVEWTD